MMIMEGYSFGFILLVAIIVAFLIVTIAVVQMIDTETKMNTRMEIFSADELLNFAAKRDSLDYSKLSAKQQRIWNAFYYANDVFKHKVSFDNLSHPSALRLIDWCIEHLESISDLGLDFGYYKNDPSVLVKRFGLHDSRNTRLTFSFRDQETAVLFRLSQEEV